MTKRFLAFAAFLLASSVSGQRARPITLPTPAPTYITRYDFLNMDELLSNDRLVKRFVECLLDKAPCTREGLILKGIIPDALNTSCSKCNDVQRRNVGKVFAYLLQFKPEYWYELLDKFDKDGRFRRKYGVDTSDTNPTRVQTRNTFKNKKGPPRRTNAGNNISGCCSNTQNNERPSIGKPSENLPGKRKGSYKCVFVPDQG